MARRPQERGQDCCSGHTSPDKPPIYAHPPHTPCRAPQNKIANSPNTNERTSIIQELLPAMKLVKYYG